jgi:hypothetical protein
MIGGRIGQGFRCNLICSIGPQSTSSWRASQGLSILDGRWLHRHVASAAERNYDPIVLEIGSWKGRSTIAMGLALLRSGRGRLFAIGPHRGEPDDPSDTMPEFLSKSTLPASLTWWNRSARSRASRSIASRIAR